MCKDITSIQKQDNNLFLTNLNNSAKQVSNEFISISPDGGVVLDDFWPEESTLRVDHLQELAGFERTAAGISLALPLIP